MNSVGDLSVEGLDGLSFDEEKDLVFFQGDELEILKNMPYEIALVPRELSEQDPSYLSIIDDPKFQVKRGGAIKSDLIRSNYDGGDKEELPVLPVPIDTSKKDIIKLLGSE